jgi:hypothetical protein
MQLTLAAQKKPIAFGSKAACAGYRLNVIAVQVPTPGT